MRSFFLCDKFSRKGLRRDFMKILHTSDWHIGKRLADRERLPEQDAVLLQIADICKKEAVDLVLVAGDIFDTYVPSAEAEELFYRRIKEIAQGRTVVLISGNHDDGVRLCAAAPFLAEHGVYLFGNKPAAVPVRAEGGAGIVESGENYAIVANKAGERVYLNLLPYPNEARLKEDKTDESYAEKTARWIARGEAGYRDDLPHILVAHVFVAGGSVSESERDIDLGGARAVPLSSLPEHGYVALGHLHKRQRAGKNGYYSGSILQYSFDEANTGKSVMLLETKGNEVELVREIPLTAGKKLVRLECNGVEEALKLLPHYEECYIELTINLDAPLTSAQTQALRECNTGLVNLIARVGGEERANVPLRSMLKADELFSLYYRSQFAADPPPELLTAFLALVKENDETENA